MESMNNEGLLFIESAKDKIKSGDLRTAANFLRKAINRFDSAINTARLNCATNFISKYEKNKSYAKELLDNTVKCEYCGELIKNIPILKQSDELSPLSRGYEERGSFNDEKKDVRKEISNCDKEKEEDLDRELYSYEKEEEKERDLDKKDNSYNNNKQEHYEETHTYSVEKSQLDNENYQEIKEELSNNNQEDDFNIRKEKESSPEIKEEIISQTRNRMPIEEKDYSKEIYGVTKNNPINEINPRKPLSEVHNDINVKLGTDEDDNVIVWKPKMQANQHFVAVGMSGTGKTTAVRTVLHQLREQDVPLIIFDLHDDFDAKKVINFGKITINPLELDGLTPKEKAIEFAFICKRIFKLGDQQENKLREAIVNCYTMKGINPLDRNTWNNSPPTLLDVNDYLEMNRDGKTIDTLLGRVKFFHRIELFMSETRCPFTDMFSGSTVIKLIEFSDNPDLQTALCEIFLNKLLFTVKKAGQSKLRAYCVIDEAHILDDGKDSYRSPLVKIAREARKYGLGLILASQMPKDFSKSVLHNTATIMSLKFNAAEEARAVSNQMYGVSEEDILNLGEVGEGFIKLGSDVKRVKFFRREDL